MMDSRVMKLILLGLAFTCIFGQKLQAQTMDSQAAKSSQTVGGTPQLHQDSEVRQTSWPSIPLPKISMPKVWMPDMSPLTGPVKSGFNKVSTGTKRAWEGTKEIFTLGGDKSSHSANGQSASEKPGFWSKMFTSEPEPVDGPQTVGEWMAQPRLDP